MSVAAGGHQWADNELVSTSGASNDVDGSYDNDARLYSYQSIFASNGSRADRCDDSGDVMRRLVHDDWWDRSHQLRHGGERLLRREQLPGRRMLRRWKVRRQRIHLHGRRNQRYLLERVVPNQCRRCLRRRRSDLLWRRHVRCGRRDGNGRLHDLYRFGCALLRRKLRQLRQPRIDVLLGRRRQRLREQPFLSSRRWRIDLRAVRRQRGGLLCRGRLRKRARLRKSRERHAAHLHELRRNGRIMLSGRRLPVGRDMHGRHDGNRRDLRRLRRHGPILLRWWRSRDLQHGIGLHRHHWERHRWPARRRRYLPSLRRCW